MVDNNSEEILEERLWIEYIRKGEDDYFESLFKKYYLPLTRFAWRYVGSEAIAEELVQELFTILWESRREWEISGSVKSYLYRSVRNLSLNHIKHQEVKKRYDKEWGDGETYSEIEFYDDAHLQQVRNAIKQAIDELPVQSRMTYSLHRYDGLTYQEIAEVLEIPVKTVESRMTRTLKQLRTRLSYLLPLLLVMLQAG